MKPTATTTSLNRTTLDQWRTFVAIVDYGGYAQAAKALNKSQSTLSYSITKLEDQLGVRVFTLESRKAQLTNTGEALLRRARSVLEGAGDLESLAQSIAKGWETELTIAVDTLFPNHLLMKALAAFSLEVPEMRIEILETVLSGTNDALTNGTAQLAISGSMSEGLVGDQLIRLERSVVAHPDHPLHKMGRDISLDDLKNHRQIVVRDSGVDRRFDAGWLKADQRWTFSHMSTSIEALCEGLGFAWIPKAKILDHLAEGRLKPLPLIEGKTKFTELYIMTNSHVNKGPGVKKLINCLKKACSEY